MILVGFLGRVFLGRSEIKAADPGLQARLAACGTPSLAWKEFRACEAIHARIDGGAL